MVERAVVACLSVLVGAIALYVAMRLLLAVWLPFVVFGGSAVAIGVAIWTVRGRRRGW